MNAGRQRKGINGDKAHLKKLIVGSEGKIADSIKIDVYIYAVYVCFETLCLRSINSLILFRIRKNCLISGRSLLQEG
jgi:hypothetical protein